MTKLSVNINKFGTLRNSRGGNNPDVLAAAMNAELFGADGITVHPRPDERHIRYADVRQIKAAIKVELNIEGNCREPAFIDLVLEVAPAQVTLVPDEGGHLTSDHGWDTVRNRAYLSGMTGVFKKAGIRVSLFVDPVPEMVEGAAAVGADRVELYTEQYARQYIHNKETAIRDYVAAADTARSAGLGINAGHDLDRENLAYFARTIPHIDEVSIGHALICDALYLGFENAIQIYKRQLAT